ncbi:hypothetical protein CHO01_31330 [Cellulomonas hominis]|uniref:Alpha-tubulin suppressor-like RCC1 family protein n=1 Tax=Cellulomonas hominis TaxID=156981 RepID=A0A511FI37_9CELL|nr:RCC1 domain-containing protein [Cellulomonas hominis]MBB5473335.1 alpha-tubulin suppressor-like RCC1 family protein [Cellulomonas hominis]NKY07091.1 hypothetical protein [Cellulomonas hominis]GEL48017.1 hypothetical protein CHO01_31330 [Cellulomonas hominis]
MPVPFVVSATALLLTAVLPSGGPTSGGTVVTVPADRFVFAQVAAGEQHTVGLASDGTVWAWGDNSVGQLGDGTSTASAVPTAVVGLEGVRIVQVDAGYSHSIALADDGRVFTWGYGFYGQLGDGSGVTSDVPVQVPPSELDDQPVVLVDAGPYTSAAVGADGTAYAWGQGTSGQLGDGTGVNRRVPVTVDTSAAGPGARVVDVDAGWRHGIALTDQGEVLTWGDDAEGQLGRGFGGQAMTPVLVSGVLDGVEVVDVAAGGWHSLALDGAGRAYAWGAGVQGQLGGGSTSGSALPAPVTSGSVRFRALDGGYEHSVALSADGVPYVWGDNGLGALGQPHAPSSPVPVPVELGGDGAVQVSAGWEHVVALTADGIPVTWGNNADGQAGDGVVGGATGPRPALMPEVQLNVGGAPATDVSWTGSEFLTGVTPAHASGVVDIDVVQGGNGRYPRTVSSLIDSYTFGTAPVVEASPVSVVTRPGEIVELAARASGDETPTAQWQQWSSADEKWVDVPGQTGSGAATTLSVTAPEGGVVRYRVVFANPLGSAVSEIAEITVPIVVDADQPQPGAEPGATGPVAPTSADRDVAPSGRLAVTGAGLLGPVILAALVLAAGLVARKLASSGLRAGRGA